MKRLKRLKRVRANKLSKIEQTDESFLFSFALGPKTAGLRAAMGQGSWGLAPNPLPCQILRSFNASPTLKSSCLVAKAAVKSKIPWVKYGQINVDRDYFH